MNKPLALAALALASACFAPRTAAAEPPSTGLGMTITGGVFTGVGVLNLATSPVCGSSAIKSNLQGLCLGLSLTFGGVFTLVGVPLLVVGLNRRSHYQEWKRRNGAFDALTKFGVTPAPGGSTLTWQTAF